MEETKLDKETEDLIAKAHDIEALMHSYVTACQGPDIDALKQQLIDITLQLDEIRQTMDKKISEQY